MCFGGDGVNGVTVGDEGLREVTVGFGGDERRAGRHASRRSGQRYEEEEEAGTKKREPP